MHSLLLSFFFLGRPARSRPTPHEVRDIGEPCTLLRSPTNHPTLFDVTFSAAFAFFPWSPYPPQMKHAISTSYAPPQDASGVVALMALDQWVEEGLKLEEGKYGLGFPFMYLLLTGTMGLKVGSWRRSSHNSSAARCGAVRWSSLVSPLMCFDSALVVLADVLWSSTSDEAHAATAFVQ